MKKLHFFICLLSLATMSMSAGTLRLKGKLAMKGDTVEVRLFDVVSGKPSFSGVAVAKGGSFSIDLEMEKVCYLALTYWAPTGDRQENMSFTAVPDETLQIDATAEGIKVSGSKFYTDYQAFDEFNRSYMDKWAAMSKDFNAKMADKKTDKDSLKKVIGKCREALNKEISEKAIAYIKANSTSDVAVVMLNNVHCMQTAEAAKLLSEQTRNGRMKEYCDVTVRNAQKKAIRLEAEKNLKEGSTVPDFALADRNGKKIRLSELRGKHVVIDFWGTWCGWCIKGMPEMKKYYEKYNGKLEILGIACNDKEEKWKQTLDKLQLPWLNVINDADSDVTALYDVKGYPTKIVIDPQGRMLKRVEGESPDFYTFIDKELGGGNPE